MVRRPIPPLGALACIASMFAGVAFAQNSDDVAREVQRLRIQIDQERKSIALDSSRQAEWRSQNKARLASMRFEAQRLAKERDSLRQVLDRSSRPKAPAAPPVTPAAARKKAFSEALAREIDRTIPLLAQELDAGSELKDQWGRLSKGLRNGTDDPSEALGRFLDDVSERIDMGSRIGTHPGTFTDPSGRALRGTFLDIGGTMQVFVDRDGMKAAVRMRGELILNEVVNPGQIAALAKAAQIFSGQGQPGWVFLPLLGASK